MSRQIYIIDRRISTIGNAATCWTRAARRTTRSEPMVNGPTETCCRWSGWHVRRGEGRGLAFCVDPKGHPPQDRHARRRLKAAGGPHRMLTIRPRRSSGGVGMAPILQPSPRLLVRRPAVLSRALERWWVRPVLNADADRYWNGR
jgi:hypothetical protein